MVDVGNKTRILGSVEGCGYEKGMGLMGVGRLLNCVYMNFYILLEEHAKIIKKPFV